MLGELKFSAPAVAVASLAALLVAGCRGPEKYLITDPQVIEMAADELTAGIAVEATSPWMVDHSGVASTEWLSGFRYDEGGSALWVTLAGPNQSLEPRTTQITIVSGDGLKTLVPLVQLAAEVWLDVSPETLEPFDGQGKTTRTLTVDTNLEGEWVFEGMTPWLLVTPDGDEGIGESDGRGGRRYTLTVGVEPSREIDPRRDTLVVRPLLAAYASLATAIPIVQQGLGLMAASREYMNEQTLTLELPAQAVEVPLTVLSWDEWTVSTVGDAEGVASLSVAGGSANTAEGTVVILSLPRNTLPTPRTFTLVFESAGETYEYSVVQGVDDEQ